MKEDNLEEKKSSIYDWEKSLQGKPTPTEKPTLNPKAQEKIQNKTQQPNGTIDYFIKQQNQEYAGKDPDKDELDDIGDVIFRKVVEKWKMKHL